MFTRQDYLNGLCSHDQYYDQFVTDDIKKIVISAFGIERIKKSFASDKYMNDIPLKSWDNLARFVKPDMKQYGDRLTLAGQVCILKAAARQVAQS